MSRVPVDVMLRRGIYTKGLLHTNIMYRNDETHDKHASLAPLPRLLCLSPALHSCIVTLNFPPQVLGSGSSRVITISASAQSRRWTSDLVKLLKAQPGRAILPMDIPQLYQATFGRAFSPVDYGVCTLSELMLRVTPQAVTIAADGTISLPRRTPTPEERSRTVQFALQVNIHNILNHYYKLFLLVNKQFGIWS